MRRIRFSRWVAFAGSQFVFAGYSGEPFSNRAFNLGLRAACRAIGVGGDYRPRVAAQRGDNPPQWRREGFAGNPGAAPSQEYPHHSALSRVGYNRPGRRQKHSAELCSEEPQWVESVSTFSRASWSRFAFRLPWEFIETENPL